MGCSSTKPYKITLENVDNAVAQLMDELQDSHFVTALAGTLNERAGIAIDKIVLESDQRVNTERIRQTFENRVVNFGVFEVVS